MKWKIFIIVSIICLVLVVGGLIFMNKGRLVLLGLDKDTKSGIVSTSEISPTSIYSPDKIFTKLISNTADLTGGEAIFEINNPNDLNIKDLFSLSFTGNNVSSYEIYINCSKDNNVTLYKDVLVKQRCSDNITKDYDCSYNDTIITGYQINQIEDWCKLNSSIVKKGIYKIKLDAHWEAKLGNNNIDWVPILTIPKSISLTTDDLVVSKDAWAWWNTTWLYKKAIVLNSTVSSTLTNFPAEFIVDTASLITAGKMNSSCKDLRITNGSEDTLMNYEIVGCNSATTTIFLSYPSFGTGNNTVYMYYGNPSAQDSQNAYAIWALVSTLKSVYHLESVTGTINDSVNQANGTIGGNGTLITAEYYNGYNLTGGGASSINKTTSPTTMYVANSTQSWYISTWIKPNYLQQYTGPDTMDIFSDYVTTGAYGPQMGILAEGCGVSNGNGSRICGIFYQGTTQYKVIPAWNYTAGQVYYVGLASNNTGTYLIVNGTIQAYDTHPSQTSQSASRIGNDWTGAQMRGFKGWIDEFRLYNSTPTMDWIGAEYGQLYSIGTEQSNTGVSNCWGYDSATKMTSIPVGCLYKAGTL